MKEGLINISHDDIASYDLDPSRAKLKETNSSFPVAENLKVTVTK